VENKLKLAQLKAKRRKEKQDASETILRRLEEAVDRMNQTVEVDTSGIEKILSEFEVTPTFKSGDIVVDTEVFTKKIDEVRALVEEKKVVPESDIKKPLEELVESLKLKPSQDPSEFIPYRRVVQDGKRLKFDDSIAAGGSWAGGSSGSSIDLPTYGIARINDSANPAYYGFEDDNGNWYVLRQNDTTQTWKYAVGTGGIETVWINNTDTTYTGLTYVDKGAAF
jgi:hypothetical protein